MEIFYVLLVLLVVTKVFGEVAVRLGQPALVGELLSGIALGLAARSFSGWLPVLSTLTDDHVFVALTDLGVFFLMLYAGLDMRPKDLVEASGTSCLVALSAMVLPFAMGWGAAWYFLPDSDYKVAQSLFVGVALAITAVPVAVKVLMDLGILHTRAGQLVVSAAVFDDVFSLLLLAVLTAVIRTGTLPDAVGISFLAGKIIVFFVLTILAGRFLFPVFGSFVRRLMSDEFEFSFLLMAGLAFGLLAEWMGMHVIMGAFVAGLFFGRQTIDTESYDDVMNKVSGLTTGFLAPIFFASIGLHLDLTALSAVPGFVTLLIAIAFLSKLLGASLPSYWLGLSARQSIGVGVAMSARGAVELIVADVALRAGLFQKPDVGQPVIEHMFSAIVIVAVVTTLAVPIILPAFAHSIGNSSERTDSGASGESPPSDAD